MKNRPCHYFALLLFSVTISANRAQAELERVSTTVTGDQANGASQGRFNLSTNGIFVTFKSNASNLADRSGQGRQDPSDPENQVKNL